MNFEKLNLPNYDIKSILDNMLEDKVVHWTDLNQICINTVKGEEDNFLYGAGSLFYDWSNGEEVYDEKGHMRHIPAKRETPLKEADFTNLCNLFKNTVFEDLYNVLKENYNVGRVRLMKSPPKTCLSWHVDDTKRIHYPIVTQEGCFMLIEDEVKHLPQHTWWITNTLVKHTALNASLEDRVHLVATLIE